MPEMPEVETIARTLRASILGKEIVDVRLSGLPLRRPVKDTLVGELAGRRIQRIHRRGKYLIAELQPRWYWLIHLGMAGRIVYDSAGLPLEPHTHAVIRFSDRTELRYTDHRRFGLMAAYGVPRLGLIPELQALGCDPLSSRFSEDWLWARLRSCKQEIKAFLLDQRKIAGLGNIYACEALFRARIHPTRRCHRLSREEARRLRAAIRWVLRTAIRHRGTSFSDYMDAGGRRGENQFHLRVFQRDGEKCRRCGARIVKLRQGNRSSFCCPRCQ
jgi:formamidopyrimidine-DNA glycosylase